MDVKVTVLVITVLCSCDVFEVLVSVVSAMGLYVAVATGSYGFYNYDELIMEPSY